MTEDCTQLSRIVACADPLLFLELTNAHNISLHHHIIVKYFVCVTVLYVTGTREILCKAIGYAWVEALELFTYKVFTTFGVVGYD